MLALGNAWLKRRPTVSGMPGSGWRLLESTGKVVTNEPSVIGYFLGIDGTPRSPSGIWDGFRAGALAAMFVRYDGRTRPAKAASAWRIDPGSC